MGDENQICIKIYFLGILIYKVINTPCSMFDEDWRLNQ